MTQIHAIRLRGIDRPLTEVNYAEQAQKDFAMYARMTEVELVEYMRRWQHPRRGRISRKKRTILEIMNTNPRIRPAEAAKIVGTTYDYAWRVMRGLK